MNDYISRKAVLELLQGSDVTGYKPSALREMVERLPDAEVHGRWIKGTNWSVTCSVCGCLGIAHDGKNFCPYCGAKMDEGESDGN